jgi:5-methylcytosine-specific restriction enzyme A
MTRSVPEWRGKTDDAKVPPRVRLRCFERAGGVCHISGRKIAAGEKWELDHIKPLILGGKHAEFNLAPALVAPHREKSAGEVTLKSKIERMRQKHLGIFAKSPFKIRSRGFQRRAP